MPPSDNEDDEDVKLLDDLVERIYNHQFLESIDDSGEHIFIDEITTKPNPEDQEWRAFEEELNLNFNRATAVSLVLITNIKLD